MRLSLIMNCTESMLHLDGFKIYTYPLAGKTCTITKAASHLTFCNYLSNIIRIIALAIIFPVSLTALALRTYNRARAINCAKQVTSAQQFSRSKGEGCGIGSTHNGQLPQATSNPIVRINTLLKPHPETLNFRSIQQTVRRDYIEKAAAPGSLGNRITCLAPGIHLVQFNNMELHSFDDPPYIYQIPKSTTNNTPQIHFGYRIWVPAGDSDMTPLELPVLNYTCSKVASGKDFNAIKHAIISALITLNTKESVLFAFSHAQSQAPTLAALLIAILYNTTYEEAIGYIQTKKQITSPTELRDTPLYLRHLDALKTDRDIINQVRIFQRSCQ